jgi:hypothetical protein
VRRLNSALTDVTRRNFAGRLPIHWAIERLLPLPTLVCIDDANPVEGASKPDHRGAYCQRYFLATLD